MPYCPQCGVITAEATVCPCCGVSTAATTKNGQTAKLYPAVSPFPPTVIAPTAPAPPAWLTATPAPKPSVLAVIGCVLSILCIFLSSLKLFALIGLIPAVLLSVFGLLKSPVTRRGLSIAALIVCSVALTMILVFTVRSYLYPNDFLDTESVYDDYYGYDPFGGFYDDFIDDGYSYES